ncbi:8-oxo-dGTP diphosphatase MutT [Lachnospiraceae bacterium MD1]|jgi:8-oxo-dGTP diphosphatase|uniref:8-oxo-dGTP diphosphatase n=1 Tax=Variimorphobacter saccharofermentans TaxID=2755051 RepID=A0A839JVC2_9FIRM|nr:8-oxo-dGTP diphosphatase MutT [Variimorphobacter saccharofermentans]MBB2181430.1 8-oxo-dGTP diphosphatase MutT [Variimorphobacter saccharofermentans]
MKSIEVAAAIIIQNKSIFATERGYGDFKGYWEFPGGKIEEGETPQEALVREMMEELNVRIKVQELVEIVNYDYPDFHLTMHCFLCKIISGDMILKEHTSARWLTKDHINEVDWLPADKDLIEKLKSRL